MTPKFCNAKWILFFDSQVVCVCEKQAKTNMSNNDIQQFKDFTGADDQTAKQFLGMFNNNLDAAVSAFLDQGSSAAPQPQVFDNNMSDVYDQFSEPAYNPNLHGIPQQPAQPAAAVGRRLGSTADPQASDFVPLNTTPAAPKKTTTVSKEKPKFATLHNKDDDSDEENPKNNKYYAGGSKNSGTQIIGNNDSDDDDDDDMAKRIFKAAKERGAKPADLDKKQPVAAPKFVGQGNRLGSDAAVPKQPQAQPLLPLQPQPLMPQQPPQERTMTITFYSDGFTIDDGELRNPADPQSQMLLKAIESGVVPPELAKGAKSVMVSLVKKEGKYVPPPKVFKAFEGHGKSLSSAPSPTTPVSAPKPTTTTTTPKASYSCDLNKPHTSIQLRLHDGTRMVAKFNLTDAVQVLYDFVSMASGVQNFMLGSAFPKKDLTDKSQTVEQAKLQNASLVQTKL